jgi:hypothetical protein
LLGHRHGVRLAAMTSGSAQAELSTLHSQLEELTVRVVAVADRYRDTPDSAITAELDAAERALLTARRAVERAQHNLP